MEVVTENRVIVFDPALGPEGGHHVALMERIHGAHCSGEYTGAVDYYCSDEIAISLEKKFTSDRIRITRHFRSSFYRYHAASPGIAEANGFIAALGKEYLSALKSVFSKILLTDGIASTKSQELQENRKLVVFYPAMQWVHLMALHFALRQIGDTASLLNVEHRLCLMYNPGRNHIGELKNLSEWLSYKLACKSLAVFDNVRMYASDHELAEHYGHMLELESPLALHPQYLIPFGQTAKVEESKSSVKTIGLYFGDAKIEKGFNRLPAIIEHLLPIIGPNDKLVVQYVSQRNCPRVVATEKAIRALSKSESKIKLIVGFLPSEELRAILSSLDLYVFTYDAKHYQDKSSGFLWLLAEEYCKLILLGESWLSREAERLRLNARVCELLELPNVLSSLLLESPLESKKEQKSLGFKKEQADLGYRERLLYPFFQWLDSEY
uniref:hypothetical protein n=1 Tax=Microbulbifer agarilyticus TaxID=260552 RepID=UPI000255B93C|nr:hypothetical protein [Microbulbifer agarilyticus]